MDFLTKYHLLLSKLLNSPVNSKNIDHVVEAYFEAISAAYPKNRYPLGKDARFFWIPLSNMFAWIQDPVIRLFFRAFESKAKKNFIKTKI
uniref:Uncharacterized protein n=1 Tax=Ditylenchus dipsaci TaxID=166011 RepID=A0A915CVT8_9BILA